MITMFASRRGLPDGWQRVLRRIINEHGDNADQVSTSVFQRAEVGSGFCHTARGFSLVELMIALVLGLLVVGAAVSVFISNRQTFRTAENMARLQENARFAFEMLTREIREAGGNPCGAKRVASAIKNGSEWWWAWGNGTLKGYEGNQAGPKGFGVGPSARVNGTDGIRLLSANLAEPVLLIRQNSPSWGSVPPNHGFDSNDVVMACSGDVATILQLTSRSWINVSWSCGLNDLLCQWNKIAPGNCKIFGWNTLLLGCKDNKNYCKCEESCWPTNSNPWVCGEFVLNINPVGQISFSKYSASFWYIGNNPRGRRSLYRLGFTGNPKNQDNQPIGQAEEIAEGVTDMQIEYLMRDASGNLENAYRSASDVADWDRVVAVRTKLTFQTQDKVGANNQPVSRALIHVTGVRNRLE